jgi:aryl-phospho-beta-D-glucosidase BglC (GH1 family)
VSEKGLGMTNTANKFRPLRTVRRNIENPDGNTVILRSVNWFGGETEHCLPHGIWQRSYKSILHLVAGWGFNCLRLPFSGATFGPGRHVKDVSRQWPDNSVFFEPDGINFVHPFKAMDAIISYAAELGLYVVLDHHRREAGNGADGSPTGAGYTQADWIATWTDVAKHFKASPNVIGADLHNEPYTLDWDKWASMAEDCGNAIHQFAPDWLIFVEGVRV